MSSYKLITVMSSRVIPLEIVSLKTKKMSVSAEEQGSINAGCHYEPGKTEENVNEELLRAVEEIYSTLLKAMKCFGAYFGDTSFNRFFQGGSSSGQKTWSYVCAGFCCLMVLGQWFNVAIPLVCVFFYGSKIYTLLFFDMWCLLVALNITVSLIVLPLTGVWKSRFEKFISYLRLVQSKSIRLEKTKSKGKIYLVVSGFFIVAVGIGGIYILVHILDMNFGNHKPWNAWSGFRIIYPFFLTIGVALWLLPMVFYCTTCLLLEALFDDLDMRKASLDLTTLRLEHYSLCRVVELADNLLSPAILMVVGLCIPFICFALYQIAKIDHFPKQETLGFLVITIIWLLASSAELAVVMIFGSKVNDKVRNRKQVKASGMTLTEKILD